MNIGLIDVDSHNFPNLALMKISAWHKRQGDKVEWWNGLFYYDRVYMSKVFTDEYTPDTITAIQADEVIRGGSGYDLKNKLPDEIEHICPDYSLYGVKGSFGFCTRGCPRGCPFCCVAEKEGRKSVAVAEPSEWYRGGEIKLLDPNLLACKDHMKLIGLLAETKARIDFTQGLDARLLTEDNINALNAVNTKMLHFAWDMMKESEAVLRGLKLYAKHGAIHNERGRAVYTLTNYDTSHEEDLERIYKLKELGYTPYVMIFDKSKAPRKTRLIQRWVNNRIIFRSCARFEDYNPKLG
jgi:hypothetical protein